MPSFKGKPLFPLHLPQTHTNDHFRLHLIHPCGPIVGTYPCLDCPHSIYA
jgi:hypothetical protein